MDQRRIEAVDLLAQVADVGLDDVGIAVEVVVPHVVEDLALGQDPAGVLEQVPQQVELGGRQLDERALAPDLVGLVVHLEVREREPLAVHGGYGAAQHGVDPGHELVEAEGLGHVVVAPGGESPDLVLGGVARRQEQHGRAVPLGPQPSAHLGAVDVGQHDVQEDQVVVAPLGQRHGIAPGGGGVDRETLEAQGGAEQVGDVGLVVDHQDPGQRAHPSMFSDGDPHDPANPAHP